MTASQLIEALQKLDGDTDVILWMIVNKSTRKAKSCWATSSGVLDIERGCVAIKGQESRCREDWPINRNHLAVGRARLKGEK